MSDPNPVDSARVVIRRLTEVGVPLSRLRSAVDLGCGFGAWLAALESLGLVDVLGLDLIDPRRRPPLVKLFRGPFRLGNLATPLPDLGRRFDIALGLEVGEHLDGGDVAAEAYVGNLTSAADLVLFSAAIPGQGGNHHVNEQWPEYWAARFRERGYAAADAVRPLIWDDERVLWWYRQNALLFFRRGSGWGDALGRHVVNPVLSLVHPICYGRGGTGRRPLK